MTQETLRMVVNGDTPSYFTEKNHKKNLDVVDMWPIELNDLVLYMTSTILH